MRSILIFVLICLGIGAYGQNESDISRYASQYYLGTARFTGLGGAMGALGGDMTAIHVNPAAVGVYRFSDITFSPGMEFNTLEAESNLGTFSGDISKLVVNNAGFVLANETRNPNWKMINFSVTFNRLNTYNDDLFVESDLGNNQTLQQDFILESNGFLPQELSPYSGRLAFDAIVTDTLPGNSTNYVGRIPGDINQIQTAARDGRHTETALSFGANYKDRLMLGASIGIQNITYSLDAETNESPVISESTDLQEYTFREELLIEGIGVNFKLGAIYRAGKVIRIGASVQTPTVLNLTDNFLNSIQARYVNPAEIFEFDSPAGTFQYRVRTPWRFMGSIAGVIGKKGILTAQYELTNYQNGELRTSNNFPDADFSQANQVADQNFSSMHIYRLGGEYRITPNFYLRGGFAYFTNPLTGNEFTDANLDRMQYSGGLGYKKSVWSIDLSFQQTQFEQAYQANFSAPVTILSATYTSAMLSVGVRL